MANSRRRSGGAFMRHDKERKHEKAAVFMEKITSRKAAVFFMGCLLFSNVATFVYFAVVEKGGAETVPNSGQDFLNPARRFYGREDLIINVQPVRDYLNGKYGEDPRISVYFEFLNTGANITINKDAEFFPASLLKLPVAMAVARKVEEGEWRWDNELVLMRGDKDELFGTLYREPIGSKFTVGNLVEKMLVESDNTAYRILLRNLEPAELEDVQEHLGLREFFSSDGRISAKRYSVMLRSLYNSSYLSDANSLHILETLSRTPFDEYLGSALPESLRFSHKIGVSDEKQVFMDAGLVYAPNRPYILTVMIRTDDQAMAKDVMKDISGKVYEYITGYEDGGS